MTVTKTHASTYDLYQGDSANDYISADPKGLSGTPTYMYGGGGNDYLFGSQGWDYMNGGDGDDYLSDTCQGVLHGDAGNDYLEISSGGGTLYGDGGNDTLTSGSGESTLLGGAGNDTFVFSKSQNYGYCAIDGGDATHTGSNPNASDFHGQDKIVAYGDNTVIGLKSMTRIDSITGNGSHTTIQTANTATSLDFSHTTLTGIAQITGLDGNDTIIGSSGNDTIYGGFSSNDSLYGGDGDDFLMGSGTLTGGAGSDKFFTNGSAIVKDFNLNEDYIYAPSNLTVTGHADSTAGVSVSFSNGVSMMLSGTITYNMISDRILFH